MSCIVENRGLKDIHCIAQNAALFVDIFCYYYDTKYFRERLAEALQADGYCYKYDISLPLSVYYQLVIDMREQLGERYFMDLVDRNKKILNDRAERHALK